MEKDEFENIYECDQNNCKFKTKYKKSLDRHKFLVHSLGSGKIYNCSENGCDYKTKTKSNLEKHLWEIHLIGSGKFAVCPHHDCDFKSNKRGLKKHMLDVHKIEKPLIICSESECEYTTRNIYHFKRHLFSVHKKGNMPIFYCKKDNCNFKTCDNFLLKKHIWCVHNENEGNFMIFKCPKDGCKYETKYKDKLDRHISTIHDKQKCHIYKCTEKDCNFNTIYKESLVTHILLFHKFDDSKLLYCNEKNCNYKCKRSSDLKRHLLFKHNIGDLKIYKCLEDNCNFEAKSKGNLKQHLSNAHDIGDKECTICLKNVFTLTSFKDPKTKETYKGCRNCYRKITGYTSRVEKQMVEFLRNDDRISPYIISHDKITKGVKCDTKCRADLVIRSTDITIIIECDEFQHLRSKYEHLCEMARMDKLLDEFEDTKCVFIRWNPNNCKKDGKQYKKTIDERLKELTELVLEIANNNYDDSILVYYMYYNIDNHLITNRHPFKLLY